MKFNIYNIADYVIPKHAEILKTAELKANLYKDPSIYRKALQEMADKYNKLSSSKK